MNHRRSGKILFFAAFGTFAPYFDLPCIRLFTPAVSSVPLMIWYLTPGRSLTLPPLIRTTLCSCRLCPIPGIYAVTSIPFVRRTLAIFLKAEFGFFGVTVLTTEHTPLFWGLLMSVLLLVRLLKPFCSAGEVDFFSIVCRPIPNQLVKCRHFSFTSVPIHCITRKHDLNESFVQIA